MLKTIIIDDEQHCINNLIHLLSFKKDVNIIGVAMTVKSAQEIIIKNNPDLLILDIDLGDGTGFDLLELFPNPTFQVIFATGHNEYAIKAFKHSAIDYLMKPVEKQGLESAIDKVFQQKNNSGNTQKLELMIKSLQQNKFSKLALPSMDSCEFVNKEEIICCESESNYTYFYLSDDRKVLSTMNLKRVSEILTDANFFRIHKSFLININFIKKTLKTEGGIVILENNLEIPIARRRKDEFMNLLGIGK
jgi:two-component system LytT family response regulator